VEKDLLAGVAPGKGRFRSFLLVCLKRFICNWRENAAALKRGGGKPVVSIDLEDAERRYRCEPSHELTAERIFERRWALTVLQRALAVVSGEFERKGRSELLNELKVYLAAESTAPPFSEVAQKLGITESAARTAVFRLRQRYRLALENEIAATLGDADDLDEELRSLMAAVSR
jgi:RNA polymerase sigma-70 factor (ECF subfamily)